MRWVLSCLVAFLSVGSSAVRADDGPESVLTSLLTAELDRRPGLSVLSSADVQQALALEAQKQALGCDNDSCLAELAGALGVDFIVHGQLGQLERSQALTLSLFDAQGARSAGRTVLRGDSVDALAAQLPQGVDALLARLPASTASADRAPRTLLVMDLRRAGVDEPGSTASAGFELPVVPALGGGALALGALTALGGGVLGFLAMQANAQAEDQGTTQAAAAALYDQRDTQAILANILYGVGGALAVIGTSVLVLGLLGGE